MSKIDMVRAAIEALGQDAKPRTIREWILNQHNVEIKTHMISCYKGSLKNPDVKPGQPGRRTKVSTKTAAGTGTTITVAEGQTKTAASVSVDDILALKALIIKLGLPEVQRLATALAQ